MKTLLWATTVVAIAVACLAPFYRSLHETAKLRFALITTVFVFGVVVFALTHRCCRRRDIGATLLLLPGPSRVYQVLGAVYVTGGFFLVLPILIEPRTSIELVLVLVFSVSYLSDRYLLPLVLPSVYHRVALREDGIRLASGQCVPWRRIRVPEDALGKDAEIIKLTTNSPVIDGPMSLRIPADQWEEATKVFRKYLRDFPVSDG